MSSIEYLRVFSDSAGCSHFEAKTIELAAQNYAPPAPPLNISPLQTAKHSLFLELPAGWYGDWHPTPVRQWMVLISGVCEVEAGDGQRVTCRAGDVVMLDDLTGKGHRTEVVGDQPVRIAAVHLE